MTQASYAVADRACLAPLFAEGPYPHGMVAAVLSGWHGRVFADHPLRPRCAVVTAGDFLMCGGAPGPMAAHLLRCATESEPRDWLLDAPGPWQAVLERLRPVRPVTRASFDPAVQPADAAMAQLLARAGEGISFQMIEGPWVERCRAQEWSRDFVSQFADASAYAARGLGTLVLRGGEPVAGAGSYLAYPGGFEVQVQTRDGFEGQGLATLASARLIQAAHARGLSATWDAANATSAHLARKLGYVPTGEYTVFEFSE